MPTDTQLDTSTDAVNHPLIIAIGGSAGGQEAIIELLGHLTDTTGFAFVYIQHLSPDHDSHLAEILGRSTKMPVLEAVHLTPVQPNHVYILPPNQEMELQEDGKLLLLPRTRPVYMPIDRFFVSLSEQQQAGAVAILLSGMATDGTLGLKAIKVAGGITMAQNSTARFQTMPNSAIHEGVVDLVLPPKEMADEVVRLSKQADTLKLTIGPDEETEQEELLAEEIEPKKALNGSENTDDLRPIIQLIQKTIGVDFSQYKVTTIRRRIIRRMLLYKLDDLAAYTRYLREHPAEARVLHKDRKSVV